MNDALVYSGIYRIAEKIIMTKPSRMGLGWPFIRGAAVVAEPQYLTLAEYAGVVADHIFRGGKIDLPRLASDNQTFDGTRTYDLDKATKRAYQPFETLTVTADVVQKIWNTPDFNMKAGRQLSPGLPSAQCFASHLGPTTKQSFYAYMHGVRGATGPQFGRRPN